MKFLIDGHVAWTSNVVPITRLIWLILGIRLYWFMRYILRVRLPIFFLNFKWTYDGHRRKNKYKLWTNIKIKVCNKYFSRVMNVKQINIKYITGRPLQWKYLQYRKLHEWKTNYIVFIREKNWLMQQRPKDGNFFLRILFLMRPHIYYLHIVYCFCDILINTKKLRTMYYLEHDRRCR